MTINLFIVLAAILISVISSIIPMRGADVWYPQFVAVMGFCFLGLAYQISKMSKALGWFFAYCVFSTVFIAHQHPLSMIYLMQLGLALLLARHISKLSGADRGKVWYVILYVLLLQCAWGILQFFHLDPFFRYTADQSQFDTVGFSGSHNQYGLFLAACSSAAWLICPYVIPLVVIGLVLSKTLSTLVAFAVASIFIAIFRFKQLNKLWLVPIVIITIAGVSFLSQFKGNEKVQERLAIWKLSIDQVNQGHANMVMENPLDKKTTVTKVMACNPIFGYGLGAFFKISPPTQGKIIFKGYSHRYEHAHNDFVETFFDLGYLGIALLIWVLAEFIFLFHKVREKSNMLICSAGALIAYCVSAMGIYTVHVAVGGFYLAVFIGLYFGSLKDSEVKHV